MHSANQTDVMRLSEQVVLVTGSSRGLGAAIARAFAREGARVVVNCLHNETAAKALAQEIGGLAIVADVTSAPQVQALFQQVADELGRPITTVVNSALAKFQFDGDARPTLDRISWAAFDAQLQGAVRAALNTTQAALPGFASLGSGRIINIGSNLVSHPVVPYQDYTTAKGALLAFTRTSAQELGPQAVTCNMVSGGLLRTTDASSSTPESVFRQVEAVTPLRKVTTPEDVAGAVLFFASPWAAGITGQNLNVDGGLVMT